MRRSWLQTTLAETVAVVMLLSTGFSPALRHAHPGGDQPHHRHSRLLPPFSPHPAGGMPGAAEIASAEHETPHLHVAWFGLEFTFLDGCPGSDAGTEDPVPRDGVLVQLQHDCLFNVSDQAVDRTMLIFVPHVLSLACGAAVIVEPSISAAPVKGPPLCDRARHERSGVQLI